MASKVSKNAFTYSKLPRGEYIRILRILHPRKGSDTPRKLLSTYPLAEAENNYIAVAYAWGDQSQTKSILINDLDFQVGENIIQFLSQARHHVKTYISASLWIDAICINQVDTEERNEQVQLMGKFYEQANRVTIWLGCEDRGTKMLFHCLQHVAKHERKGYYTQPFDLSKALSTTTRVLQKNRLSSLIKSLKTELARTLVWLFENGYWKRTWIVQECLLARENWLLVCCGKRCSSLNAVMDFRHLGLEDDVFKQSAVQEWTQFSALFSHGEARSYNPGR
jgi:hypothetical protein